MTTTCPNCRRPRPGDAGAAFCMYCGSRLAASTETPGPDPNQTGDMPTRSFADVPAPDNFPDRPPDRVGNYRILRKLGAGGMGAVYEAESDDSGDRVAVKLLSPRLAANPNSVERFRQEGRLASQISHPRCVFVLGADTSAGVPFIVMELMPGTTLKDLIDARGPLPAGEAVARMLDVIDGLIEAHRLGVIHRDVKPSNCFLTADDRMKVGDFGLSKSLGGAEADKQLTSTGAFLGTVLYASPEQIRGEDVGYDSDIYSAAATLYFALTGRAPYQHESVTAALAKAISEPPAPVRTHRADCPRPLDKITLRGLERDRTRRWESLEEFRDALADQLPGKQRPARPRALFLAYLVDCLILLILIEIPVEILTAMFGNHWLMMAATGVPLDPIQWAGFTAYFALFEGLLSTTPGKRLLRLRVSRVGGVGPPGVRAAAKRAVVYNLLWLTVMVLPVWLWGVPAVGPVLALAAVAAGLYGLTRQLSARRDYRGLHDRASGCQVTQRPRPPHRVRLTGKAANVFDRATPADGLPPVVGGFAVRGVLTESAPGGAVWAAEDRSLNRRVLVWVQPVTGLETVAALVRPTRLRTVAAGEIVWAGRECWWVAYVAPDGGPLPDMIDPARPLPWADARLLLEQLADELRTADADGSLPPRLGVDQLWLEPSGRIHLLEFPLPTASPAGDAAADTLALLRRVASLALEGRPRDSAGPVRAPIPPHATAVTDRLFAAGDAGFASPKEFAAALAESHAHPPRATAGMRVAQIGVIALFSTNGLLLVLLGAIGFSFWVALLAAQQAKNVRTIQAGLDDPEVVAAWSTYGEMAKRLRAANLPERRRQLDRLADFERAEVAVEKRRLTRPERYVVERVEEWRADPKSARNIPPRAVNETFELAAFADARAGLGVTQRAGVGTILLAVASACVVASMVFAFAFRGGFTFALSGLALVTRTGRLAGRLRCAARELLIWVPLLAVAGLAVGVQSVWPDWFFGRVAAAVIAVGTLVAYGVIAVRYPERGPHDRIVGTFVVPS